MNILVKATSVSKFNSILNNDTLKDFDADLLGRRECVEELMLIRSLEYSSVISLFLLTLYLLLNTVAFINTVTGIMSVLN
ncbi:hypothetical protein RJT34_29509 [Clitoria ternatea]|uniref:Uncharacterized protein n=1 Tax=Clitoria ternatea TaxID=43366 RepID=A0AAN9FAJ4_CLITE